MKWFPWERVSLVSFFTPNTPPLLALSRTHTPSHLFSFTSTLFTHRPPFLEECMFENCLRSKPPNEEENKDESNETEPLVYADKVADGRNSPFSEEVTADDEWYAQLEKEHKKNPNRFLQW